MKKILVLHGPNLNLLGAREPDVYGTITLESINHELSELAIQNGYQLTCVQSNHEGNLIEAIHDARISGIDYIIINPAAFTHTSIAIRDALTAVDIPFIEVHLSNVYSREPFRHHSFFSDVARGVICGFGARGYRMALESIITEFK